jgi:hypothetical protein
MPDDVYETPLHAISGYVRIFLTTVKEFLIKAGDD